MNDTPANEAAESAAPQAMYQQYVSNEEWMQRYRDYQQRYATQIRESDRQILNLIGQVVGERPQQELSLLDIGCSTGNLLRHIQGHYPGLQLTGGDMTPELLDENRANPELQGMQFAFLNVLELPEAPKYDIVVVNAVLYLFTAQEFEQAIKSLAGALKPGGALIVFDFFHPYEQLLEITETSRSHPNGLRLSFRPMRWVRELLTAHGFAASDFHPFRIPIDLEKGKTFGDNADGFEDLNSYTVRTEAQSRLLFRGTLHQPWCHLVATRAQ